jgi:hypothetical protein
MSTLQHTILILGAILLVYVWLTIPALTPYSLQAFAGATLIFFIIKRIKKASVWHVLPEAHSYEIVFVTFAILLLVGATGNLESVFYSFTYIHLFFLVMTSKNKTAIVATMGVILFHYALMPATQARNIAELMNVPLLLVLFLFSKKQYDEVMIDREIIKNERAEINVLNQKESGLESFIANFLKPKLAIVREIVEVEQDLDQGDNQENNLQNIKTQIDLISSESEKILEKTEGIKK